MQPDNFRLLIHHHHIAYQDENGVIWLSANIGRWVDALSDYLGEVGLLLYQSEHRLSQQDTSIGKSNVKLYSLGVRMTVRKRFFQGGRLRRVCAEAGGNADGLLIRGVTPHQSLIWRFTPVAKKAFFLVGSLYQYSRHSPRNLMDLLLLFIRRYHLNELRHFAKNDTLMLANSPALVSEIKELFGQQAFFAPTNSILKKEFAPLLVRPVSIPWKILYCGRLDLEKGLRELIYAVAILNRDGQSCQLDVVGAILGSIYSELKKLVDELDANSFINWHDRVPYGPSLFTYYQQADAFILPTYSEGFPKVYWEAAANCCPVITTSVGGIPTLLKHEKHALLIPPKDVMAIVESVKRLFSDTNLRETIVRQAYSYAEAFTVEACAQKLVRVLAQEWK